MDSYFRLNYSEYRYKYFKMRQIFLINFIMNGIYYLNDFNNELGFGDRIKNNITEMVILKYILFLINLIVIITLIYFVVNYSIIIVEKNLNINRFYWIEFLNLEQCFFLYLGYQTLFIKRFIY